MKRVIIILLPALLLQTLPVKSNAEHVGYGILGGVVLSAFIGGVIIPWANGSWEKQWREQEKARKEQEAREKEARRIKEIQQAQELMIKTINRYSAELNILQTMHKKQLVEIITGKFGNTEFKYRNYDQELTRAICALETINPTILTNSDQQKLAQLLEQLHTLNRRKNVDLNDELVTEQQRERSLDNAQKEFNAKMNNQRELADVVKDIKSVMQEQKNERKWLETQLNSITNLIRDWRNDSRWERLFANQNPPPYQR